jgi:4-hydroxyphenylpyruvate dioxygenase
MAAANLGISRLHSIEICVHEAAPWLDFLTNGFGFQHVGISTGEVIEASGTRRSLLRCGAVGLVIQEAVHAGSAVKGYLERRPEGISKVSFLVGEVKAAEQRLLERHATPTGFIEHGRVGSEEWSELSIATPLGEVEFGFVETSDESALLMPSMEQCGDFDPGINPLGLTGIDHLTSNSRTLMPIIAFFEHVLGFTRFWDVRFHTEDLEPGVGSGLTCVVMWDQESGIKFANNEPLRPRFERSQVQICVDLNRGPGIHHIALHVGDIMRAVDHCRAADIRFLTTPRAYYQAPSGRTRLQGMGGLGHSLEEIEKREILVDGDKDGCLLQVFCKDQGRQLQRSAAGPLLFEIVQRCGCQGFGEGNFRALFEAEEQ